jgi:hypothetical protein
MIAVAARPVRNRARQLEQLVTGPRRSFYVILDPLDNRSGLE